MQGFWCEKCPLWARCCLNYKGKACRRAAREAGLDIEDTVFEKLMDMSVEEMAKWLFANCEHLSANYGKCSGAEDSTDMLEFLKSAGD